MSTIDGRERGVANRVAAFASWPPGAPAVLRRLLRRRIVRALLRRMPDAVARTLLRPLVFGRLRPGGRGIVCIASHSFAASGAPKVVLDITVDLIAAGYRVVVVSHADGPYRSILVAAGAVVIIDHKGLTRRSHTLAVFLQADVVICNTVFCHPVVNAVAARVPVFWYTHEATMIGEMLRADPGLAASFRAARGVWAVSERAADYIRPVRPDVDIVVPGTAPLMERALVPPLPNGAVRKLAVFAGIEPRKGHDLLASALNMLPAEMRARLDITVFGEVLDRPYADAWLHSIETCPNYRYAGPLPPLDVAARLVTFDGVIVPSRDEPLPLVAVEVLSVARVLLCSTCCGVAEALTNGATAFVADGCTPEALAAMLVDALRSESRWGEIAEAGYTVYRSHFTRSAMSSRVLAILNPVISPG